MTLSLPKKLVAREHITISEQHQFTSLPIFPIENSKKESKKHYKAIKKKPRVKNNSNPSKLVLTIFGILFLVLGFIVLWYYSIILGLAISLVGLILLIVGLAAEKLNDSNNNDENKKRETPLISKRDVVYLKNGSLIKGEIVEQIIGESIKIKTADGSIFIYKTSEVDKVTKE